MNRLSKPIRRAGFRLEEMDDEYLLYYPGGTQIIQFNQTAAVVWQLCDGRRTVDEIIRLLQEAYPEAAVEIDGDVQEVLNQCINNGCIDLR